MNDWKTARTGIFTASRISDLLAREKSGNGFGKTAISYIYDTLAEMLTGEPKAEIHTKSIEWGSDWEAEAMNEYIRRYGEKKEVVYFGKENPRVFSLAPELQLGGSPDGLIFDEKVIEIKCPYNTAIHIENLQLTPETFKNQRKEYYAQVQVNMLCTNTNKADFCSFDPRIIDDTLKLKVIGIKYDADFISEITEKVKEASEILRTIYKTLKNTNL